MNRTAIAGWFLWIALMVCGVAFFGCSDNQSIYGGPADSEEVPEVDGIDEDDWDLIVNVLDVS